MNLIDAGGRPMFWCIVVGIGIAGVVYGYRVLNSRQSTPVCPYVGDSACSGNCSACAVEANREIIFRTTVKEVKMGAD